MATPSSTRSQATPQWLRWFAVAAGSLLLHVVMLGGVANVIRWPAWPGARTDRPVEVALISEPAAARAAQAQPGAAAPRAAPALRPRPRPRPNAIRPQMPAAAPLPQAAVPPVAEQADAEPMQAPSEAPSGDPAVDGVAGTAGASGGASAQAVPRATGRADAPGRPGAAPDAAETAPVAASEPAAQPPVTDDAPLYGQPLTELPMPGRWSYRIYSGDYQENRAVGRNVFTWELDGSRYRFRSEGRFEGLTGWLYSGALVMESAGVVGVDGLRPEQFVDQRGKRAARSVKIDRAAHVVVFEGDRRVPLAAGAQDYLSSFVQLGLLAHALPDRFARGATFELPEVSLGRVETRRYRSEGAVALDTPQGVLRAIHLVRLTGGGPDENQFEIWLAQQPASLPVRVRLTDRNGLVIDQLIEPAGG